MCIAVSLLQMFSSVRVFRLSNANLTNQGLNKIFTDLCENLLKVRNHIEQQVITLYVAPYWCFVMALVDRSELYNAHYGTCSSFVLNYELQVFQFLVCFRVFTSSCAL